MAFSYVLLKDLGCDCPAAVAGLQLSRWASRGCTRPTSASPDWSSWPCAWYSVGSWGSSSALVQGWKTAKIWTGDLDAIALGFAAFL